MRHRFPHPARAPKCFRRAGQRRFTAPRVAEALRHTRLHALCCLWARSATRSMHTARTLAAFGAQLPHKKCSNSHTALPPPTAGSRAVDLLWHRDPALERLLGAMPVRPPVIALFTRPQAFGSRAKRTGRRGVPAPG